MQPILKILIGLLLLVSNLISDEKVYLCERSTSYAFMLTTLIVLVIIFFYHQMKLKQQNMKLQKVQSELQLSILEVANESMKVHHLNISLEKKIKEEVEKNREKDKMIFHKTKMAAMGEMIANIAHQWRQPLAIVNVKNAILKEKNNQNKLTKEDLNQYIDEIEVNILHMSQTIYDFLSYFNPNKTKENFAILEAVEKATFIIQQTILKNNIKVSIDINKEFRTYGFREEYIQVLISIITNSIQALNGKEQKKIYIKAFKNNDKITLEIVDTAGGISSEILDRVFEPYFTTKHQSQGTGLGLYIAKMIIENSMDGTLSVKNTKKGAKFIITV